MMYRLQKWILPFNILSICIGASVFFSLDIDLFDEGNLLTVLSAAQLMLIARIAYLTLQIRKGEGSAFKFHKPYAIWTLMCAGFVFLGFDEVFKIHEDIDHNLHTIFDIEESAWSDRADDVVIGFYGLIGLYFLYLYRSEILSFKATFPLFIAGFIAMAGMVFFDAISNRNDLLAYMFNTGDSLLLFNVVKVLEDSLKLLAETFFILGYLKAYFQAKDAVPLVDAQTRPV